MNEQGTNWQDWTAIIEDSDAQLFPEKPQTNEVVLEICGVDCQGRFFIERTIAKTGSDGLREFRLNAPVELDEILSIRPVPAASTDETRVSSSLFRVCNVQKHGAARTVQARLFEPLPEQSRRMRSS